jgi:hypothetical protein
MRKKVKVWCEFSKSAENVVLTARRKGYKYCPPLGEAEASDVWDIPFDVAFSRKDLAEELAYFKEQNNLTKVKIIRGEFMEMDSSNMSHAGAYYRVEVKLIKDEAVAAELIEA